MNSKSGTKPSGHKEKAKKGKEKQEVYIMQKN